MKSELLPNADIILNDPYVSLGIDVKALCDVLIAKGFITQEELDTARSDIVEYFKIRAKEERET